ncbi:cingulin isoform X2 [Electrophorus electricus]|uniref:cingulin isoform X2 n=1 Tax=Electrophorus electricus TaxID=8005 RepID=UPI0015CF90D8|nr:cingulin isoform X2 [Electrophorus electricus]
MSSPSADRKPPLDYGVQIRFIKDLDDTGGGYVERSRGVGGSAGGSGTPPSSKYGVAVRVQGISGQPYVVLKDGEKGDSYGVQLKTQPPDQIPASGHSSPFISLPRGQRDRAQTPKDPYRPFGQASSPSEESASEFGNILRRPPGDGQAGSHGEGEGGSEECPTSTPPASDLEKKDFGGLNEAGLRRVGQIGNGGAESNWPVTGKQVSQYTSAEAFSEPPASVEPTGEAIDTKSLAPINKLISKFNNSGPSNATSGMPSQTRGRSGARTHLQFDERRRSRSLDSHKEPQEQPPPSPTINPYAPIATTKSTCTLKSPTPTTYSSLGRGSASVAKVPAVSASKPPTFCLSPKTSVAMETPPSILKKHVAPELLKSQSQNTNSMYGEEAQLKQAIYNILQDGSTESDVSLRRKVSLIQECFSGIKTTPGEYGVKTVPAENERKTKQLQQQLDQIKRELGLAQDQLVELRMEKEGVESCLHQQEDELAQLQEQLRRVLENTRTDSLHMDLMAVQAEMSEAVMLRQKQEEILRMRERELTALKGALKDEVASHDKEMEALREQYRQDMEALRQSMEHVSQREIEEERQKVNASILALEEELDSYKEQGDCWSEQMISVKQEQGQHSAFQKLLQAQQEKKEMEEKLLRMRETCETDSHPLAQELQHCRRDLDQAQLKLAEQLKKEELRSSKKMNEDKELELKSEIERLMDQSKKDKEELAKLLEKTQQLPSSAQDVGTTKENSLELEEANTRLRERLARMSRLQSGSSSSNSEVLEEENRSLRIQLDEVRRTSSRLGQEKEELSRRVEEREKERESLRRSKSDLEEQKRLLDRALDKMNKEMEAMMGDSRLSVHALQSQLDEFRDRARRELQEALRLSKERLTDLQRAQGSLKSLQEEVSRLKKELLACSEERESAQLDKELLSSRLKHLESELETERTSQTDRNREIRILEDKVKSLEIELDEEKSGEELLNDRITRSREQVEQLRSELMQERSARHDLEMDKSSLERQVKELRSRITDMEGQPRPSVGVNLLESKIQELEDRLRSEEREKNSILAAQRRMERKLKDVSATLDQERNHHAEQRDQLSLRVKSLKRQVDESEEEVERLEGVRRKVLRELEEQQLLKEALQAKVSALENELKRKIQQTRRPAVASTLSSEDEDGYFDSSSITSILTESSLQTSNC